MKRAAILQSLFGLWFDQGTVLSEYLWDENHRLEDEILNWVLFLYRKELRVSMRPLQLLMDADSTKGKVHIAGTVSREQNDEPLR